MANAYDDVIFPVTEFRARIVTVDNYSMPNGRRLQIVGWESATSNISWPLFTHKQFDFGICASTFDGVECRLAHLLDVAQKRLRLQPVFAEKLDQCSPWIRDNHKNRVKRYESRGFSWESNKRLKS
jgi:hypothetical protein